MKILFIPSFNFIAGKSEPYVPYGLLCLQAVAAEFRHVQVDIAFPSELFMGSKFTSSEDVVESVLSNIDISGYDVFGFSTVCNSLHYSLSIAHRIKQRKPAAQIIFGGPFVTKLSKSVLAAFPFVDAIFVGEAENAFRDFLTRPNFRVKTFLGLAGVHTRDFPLISGKVTDDLDDLTYITEARDYFKWLEMERISIPDKSFSPIEATRGCPLKCSFCSTKQVWGAKVRRKSAGRLIKEMREIEKMTGDNFFSLTGDNVGAPRNQFIRFCEDLTELPKEFTWACSLKLDRFSKSELELMWEAGCRGMFIGIESASQITLDKVNKAASVESEANNIRLAIQMGFEVETSFIIGFPWETEQDLKDTYDLHCDFLKIGAKRSQVGVLSPIPGTEIVAEGNIFFDGSRSYFADDGIKLSTEHIAFIDSFPELFSHFGRYETPNLSTLVLNSYRDASAQMAGLFLARRQKANQLSAPFAGRSAVTP